MKQVWPTRHAHTNVYGRYYFNREQVGKKQQLRALRQSTKFSVAKTKLGGWDDRRTMVLKTEKQSYHWLYRLEDPTGYSTTWWQELQLRSLTSVRDKKRRVAASKADYRHLLSGVKVRFSENAV